MGNMPNIAGNKIPVCSCHNYNNFTLKLCFCHQKHGSKAHFLSQNQFKSLITLFLIRSDPYIIILNLVQDLINAFIYKNY